MERYDGWKSSTSRPNCSAVAIIYRENNPSQMWTQRKTFGVPYAIFTGALCPPGGNGWGDVPDVGPIDTLTRELVKEEVVGPASELFTSIMKQAQKWHAMLVPTAKLVADMATGNTKPAILTRVAYFTVAVSEDDWQQLGALEAAHPNLLTEGKSVMTSLQDVVHKGERFAYGHDQAIALFWKEHGFDTKGMQIYPNGEVERVPWLDSYEEIFAHYYVQRRPNRFAAAAIAG